MTRLFAAPRHLIALCLVLASCRSNAAPGDSGLVSAGPPSGDAGPAEAGAADAGSVDAREGGPSFRWTAQLLDEWLAKRETTPDIYPLGAVHLTFEEWFDTGHVRVLVRGDGSYAIELDGAIRASGPRYPATHRRAESSYAGSRGGFPFLQDLGDFGVGSYIQRQLSGRPALPAFPPCPLAGDDGAGSYHASMTLVLATPAPAVLHSWWTSPECAGFPRAIAREAWALVEQVTAGSVARPPWHAAAAVPRAGRDGPDCTGFGGKIHGVSTCARLDLRTGLVAPFTQRVDGKDAASLGCGAAALVNGRRVDVLCAPEPVDAADDVTRRVEVTVSVDGRPAVAVDRHEGYWDFIHIWARANEDALELTIDYGVED